MEYTKREVLAQDIMDMYYGEFKEDNENFHDIDFFERAVDDTRAELLRQEYLQGYQLLRQEGGNELVSFDSVWMKEAVIEFKEDQESGYFVADFEEKLFSFPYDKSTTAIQDLIPVRKGDCILSRTTLSQLYIQRHLPENEVQFWWLQPGKCGVRIFATKDCCKKARMFYVPAEGGEISIGAANIIKERVIEIIRKAEGKVVDQSNDSNPNVTPQTEVNKEQAK